MATLCAMQGTWQLRSGGNPSNLKEDLHHRRILSEPHYGDPMQQEAFHHHYREVLCIRIGVATLLSSLEHSFRNCVSGLLSIGFRLCFSPATPVFVPRIYNHGLPRSLPAASIQHAGHACALFYLTRFRLLRYLRLLLYHRANG